ncbi:MAG: hypothetical protein LBI91_07460 [Spirochaetaceae bacterium]|jgi:Fe-S-cluster-containing hydrogenase component 2|nr:hypothetical protein [Spirochaetaceae bacterium]
MNGNADPLLVRCTACVQTRCQVSCGCGAIVPVCGDILVETRKCAGCERLGGGSLPGCIASCPNAEEKRIAGNGDIKQKQIEAVTAMPLLESAGVIPRNPLTGSRGSFRAR